MTTHQPPGRDGAAEVRISRDLLERLVTALEQAQTKRGHLAQRVTHEHMGFCSWKSESPLCIAHREMLDQLRALLKPAAAPVRREAG